MRGTGRFGLAQGLTALAVRIGVAAARRGIGGLTLALELAEPRQSDQASQRQ